MRARSAVVGLAVLAFAGGCAADDRETETTTETTGAPRSTSGGPTTADAETTDAAVAATTTTTGPDTAPATSTTVPPPVQLDGRTFVSTAATGFELVAGTEITLTFEGDRISASGGCNRLASTWSLNGDVLVVGGVVSTRMACEPAALMDQDTWLSSLLESDPTVALDGDALTITEGQSSLTLLAAQ